ncbi:MAG: type II toxin-antitoxin system VapC family toxin [Verrucomicrobiota bacterium JB022]|nr:type II toxin-antitoxin system VapC family toxin [Verrucomicrobiota bacterium JB022]
MIVVDTSAIVAILEQEPEAERFLQALLAAELPVMSAATLVELSAVMIRKRGEAAGQIVDRLLAAVGVQIEPLTHDQALLAREAYRRFSSLNFGDCFAYALAQDKAAPLLYKGNDFGQTDVRAALPA